ncbi:MAG: response regulator transcription factor [Candidatus Eisenbacteria sp.]|nr:response regulator transcription factor [Candidatus Eisenbacteria bacterium]
MSRPYILVVEDDVPIRRGIVDALRFAGYDPLEADNGEDGLELAVRTDCDLVLLDLVLPRRQGLDVLESIRRDRPVLPVIILTARGGEDDRVKGLRLGADDYVVKPFSIKELLARVEAVLRRSPARPSDVTRVGIPGGYADLERREIRFEDGGRTPLSEREVELLRYLARNSRRAISREELLAHVWRLNPKTVGETRTIDMHVARLREKLRDDSAAPAIIATVRGKGYLFSGEEGAP